MMPAENVGNHFKCWREPICTKKNGQSYKGRACCEKVDAQFWLVESELYNLWPAVGLVNGARANYRYGIVDTPTEFYGCPMRISVLLRRAEPPNYAKGLVARANLFMSERYGVRLSDSQRQLFEAWDK
jgi:deoxyribonuclease-1